MGEMILRPVERADEDIVIAWLARKENYQWLDFGNGSQLLSPILPKVMLRKDSNLCQVFTSDSAEAPIGLVALSNVNHNFRSAMLWYVLGEKRSGGQGYTSRAVSEVLTLGFAEVGLGAVNAWAVEENAASIRILERNHFPLIGRQRQCHYIDGRGFDRLLFDLLASEHKESHPEARGVRG
jgi:RimJ/RimL family protein N-acetyltransferase